MLFWGFSFVWIKIVYENGYRPIMTIFLRLVISSLMLFLIIKLMNRGQKIQKADYGKFMLLAFFEPLLYFMGESFGLTMVSSTVAAVIVSTIPVISPMFAYMFAKEKISLINIIGLIVSFAGIMLMVVDRNFVFDASPLGVFLEFCAVMAAIFYSVAIKKLTHKYSALTIIKVQNFIGAIYFLPLFLIFDFNCFISIKPNIDLIYSLLMLSVFASSAAFVLYIPVIRELGIVRANIFTNFIPVFTAVTSYFVLSETFDLGKISGMAIVIFGVIISQVYQKKKAKKNQL